MRIEFSREGGFTGIPLTAEFDTESLSPEDASALQQVIKAADFFELPPVIGKSATGADRFQYVITIEAEGKRHTVRTSEETSEALQAAIDFLQGLARRKRGQTRSQ